MSRVLRKESRELLAWCLEQRGPFTRQDAASAMNRHVTSIRDVFNRLESLGYLEHETDYTNHQTFMVKDRKSAIEASQETAKKAYWLEAQRRARMKQQAPRRIVNSVWSLGL